MSSPSSNPKLDVDRRPVLIAGTDSNNYKVYIVYRRGKAGQNKGGKKGGIRAGLVLTRIHWLPQSLHFFLAARTCCYGTNTCHYYLASSK